MQNGDAQRIVDGFDLVLVKLEAFSEQFEHLATTTDQRKLSNDFNAFVGQMIQAFESSVEEREPGFDGPSERNAFPKMHGHETLAGLFAEIRAEELAGKREDAHQYGKDSYQSILDSKAAAPPARMEKDQGIER